MPKASKSRSKKVDTPLRQRQFAVPEKQVLEKVVITDDAITVITNNCILFIDLFTNVLLYKRLNLLTIMKLQRRILKRRLVTKHGLKVCYLVFDMVFVDLLNIFTFFRA